MITNGLKSSEFVVAVVTFVVALLKNYFPEIPQESFYIAITYILSRGLAKFGTNAQ
jgi:hypothetical protein